MSGGREGFLSRWSRLKREPDVPAAQPDPASGAPAAPALPEGKTLDDLIAELPRLEDLVPGQSLTAFMQPWVPTAVRNAARDRDLIEVASAFGFRSAHERLFKILLPAAMPGILVGLRTSLGQAWMAVVAAEIFGVPGVGQRMIQASSLLATELVVVYMLTMAALYGVLDTLFVAFQGWVLRWKA